MKSSSSSSSNVVSDHSNDGSDNVSSETVTVQLPREEGGEKAKEKFSVENMEVSAFAENVEIQNGCPP